MKNSHSTRFSRSPIMLHYKLICSPQSFTTPSRTKLIFSLVITVFDACFCTEGYLFVTPWMRHDKSTFTITILITILICIKFTELEIFSFVQLLMLQRHIFYWSTSKRNENYVYENDRKDWICYS